MKDFASKIKGVQAAKPKERGLFFHFLKWTLFILIIFFTISLLMKPLRKNWSYDYLARGDIYLEQKRYLSAELEYSKAILLFSGNKQAKTQKELAQKAEKDISRLEDFFRDRKIESEIGNFDLAKAVPATPAAAAEIAKGLIEAQEFQLAILPAKTATEMAADYKDGWYYLGVANLQTVLQAEISRDSKSFYLEKAKSALQEARNLSGDDEEISKLLEEIEKLIQ